MGALLEEVVEPHVVGALGSEPNARSAIQSQVGALGLPGWDFQPLASPDPLAPLVVDQPATPPQKLGDLAIAVAAMLPSQPCRGLYRPEASRDAIELLPTLTAGERPPPNLARSFARSPNWSAMGRGCVKTSARKSRVEGPSRFPS